MAASKFLLLSVLLALTFAATRAAELPLPNDGVSPDSAEADQLELLNSKFESLGLMQKRIRNHLENVASLQREMKLLQESLDGQVDAKKSDSQAGELEKQVERLRKDIEMQNKKKVGLEARASIAETKIQELNSKLEKLHKVSDQQENRIRKTEHLLQVAEQELMKAEVETDLISKVSNKAHREWFADWLSVHFGDFQLYMVSSWNEFWRPAMDLSLQKALEKKAQFGDWIKLQIEMIMVDWIPIMKEQWSALITFLRPFVKSLTTKIADFYDASKTSIAPHAFKMIKDLSSYAQDWFPILKKQWSTFMSSLQPRLQLLTATIIDTFHASKCFMAPHAFKVLKVLGSYTQEAKKYSESYMHQIIIGTRFCFVKVYVALKSCTVKVFHACWKLMTVSTLYHHQVTALLALSALFLFIFYSAVFRKKTKKHIQSLNRNRTRRTSKQSRPDK